MEKRTADLLVESIIYDTFPEIPADVLADYWGKNITDEKNKRIIYDVYKDLLYQRGVRRDMFHNCFLENRLDELIHAKNKTTPSEQYKKFTEKKIAIGSTFYGCPHMNEPDYSPCEECPTCLRTRFIQYDCPHCYAIICEHCSHYDEDECTDICGDCKKRKRYSRRN